MSIKLISGHGQSSQGYDPGASANGLREADVTREIVGKVAELLGSKCEVYPMKQNLVRVKDYSTYFKMGDEVVELHINSAANLLAEGCEVLVHKEVGVDKFTSDLLTAMTQTYKSRGVKYRTDLGNMNYFRSRGIKYRLLEVFFVSNQNDVKIYNASKQRIALDIAKALGYVQTAEVTATPKPVASILYRVRPSHDLKTDSLQIYAATNLENAKRECLPGYSVINASTGVVVYKVDGTAPVKKEVYPVSEYKIKVTDQDPKGLNVRVGPGVDFKLTGKTVKKDQIRTIVETQNGWGKTKEDGGWIHLKLTTTDVVVAPPKPVAKEFKVQVTVAALNVRKGAGMSFAIVDVIKDKGTYTISEESNGFGRLKSGKGWISLDKNFVKRV